MAENVEIKIRFDDSGAIKSIETMDKGFNKLAKSTQTVGTTGSLSFTRLAGSVFTAELAMRALSSAVDFFGDSLDAATKKQNALLGLSSVASALGGNVKEANAAALSLTNDGLLAISQASEGLKNLLAAGFGLPQAIDLMETFKDAAAFNRQGTLDFGDAIVGATQGIKNQNSIMVDNVGITKNLSVIMKEAGFTLQDLSDSTKGASARQALFNGLMREGALFTGDAERASAGLQGQQARLETQIFNLKASIGEGLTPSVSFLIGELSSLIEKAGTSTGNMRSLAEIMAFPISSFMIFGEAVNGVIVDIGRLELKVLEYARSYAQVSDILDPSVLTGFTESHVERIQNLIDGIALEMTHAGESAAFWAQKQTELNKLLFDFANQKNGSGKNPFPGGPAGGISESEAKRILKMREALSQANLDHLFNPQQSSVTFKDTFSGMPPWLLKPDLGRSLPSIPLPESMELPTNIYGTGGAAPLDLTGMVPSDDTLRSGIDVMASFSSEMGGILGNLTDQFGLYQQGLEGAGEAWKMFVTGQASFGAAMRQATAATLANLSKEAMVRALIHTAMGIAALTPWGAAQYGPASMQFKSAALWGLAAGASGAAARVIGGSEGTGERGGPFNPVSTTPSPFSSGFQAAQEVALDSVRIGSTARRDEAVRSLHQSAAQLASVVSVLSVESAGVLVKRGVSEQGGVVEIMTPADRQEISDSVMGRRAYA